MKLLDAHNHLHMSGPIIYENTEFICICNGTGITDWEEVAGVAEVLPSSAVPYFGVHPWFVDDLPYDWERVLREYLSGFPYGIGEIGLDRVRDRHNFDIQKRIFIKQLEIAAELEIPVSVHCVRAWGETAEILEDVFSGTEIPFMIHSFSGSAEIMERLSAAGGFFSFSGKILDVSNSRLREVFRKTPLDRILIETDFPSGIETRHVCREKYGEMLLGIYAEGSILKETSLTDFAGVLNANGKIFTNGAFAGQTQHGTS